MRLVLVNRRRVVLEPIAVLQFLTESMSHDGWLAISVHKVMGYFTNDQSNDDKNTIA